MPARQTGVIDINSDLNRKKWVREGLIQAQSTSFWSRWTSVSSGKGNANGSIIVQRNDISKGDGHQIVFDLDGNLAEYALRGKETATGTGATKRKFSDKITVERYRQVVDNGDKFDGVNLGNLAIHEHSHSRGLLADMFIRFKDQAIFDVLQGYHNSLNSVASIPPTHTIQMDCSTTKFGKSHIDNIEHMLLTSEGFRTGTFGSTTAASSRIPLKPYRMANGKAMWLVVVDPFMALNIKSNVSANGLQNIIQNADVRGSDNRAITGVLGVFGSLMFIEASKFFGTSRGKGFNDSKIEIAGMRNWDNDNSVWTGEEGFAHATHSRCLILGQTAMMIAFGKEPDYMFQESNDFKITSESGIEFWMDAQKVNLKAESEDYDVAKVSDLDLGLIALDVKIA